MRRGAGPLFIVTSVILAGCSPASAPERIEVRGKNVPVEDIQRAAGSLCTVRDLAAGGDVDQARELFDDRVHGQLHTIIDALLEKDRAFAARLFEAKHRVENDFRERDEPALAGHLDELSRETRGALEKLSLRTKECPGSRPGY